MGSSELASNTSRLKFQSLYNHKILPFFILALIFVALVVPLTLTPGIDIFDARDEQNFHFPTILDFAEDFPALDLVNYRSATTPLYHIILMFPTLVFGQHVIPLRLINAIVSLICLLFFYGVLSKRGDNLKALLFAVMLLFSPYFIGPAVRLSTDNAALLLAIAAIYSMDVTPPKTKNFFLSNLLILVTVWIRQIYAWLVGAYVLFNLWRSRRQSVNLVAMILPAVIPVGGVAYFFFLWNGLTPPPFAGHFSYGLNWDVPVYIVSLIGFLGIFFSPWLFKLYKRNAGLLPFILTTGLAVGYLLLHPVSNEYPVADGSIFYRGGALWLIASRLPNFLSSAIVFWVLFPLGLAFLYLMARYLVSRDEYLVVICLALWLAANITNKDTYQKYYEPFLLFFMGYVLVTVQTKGQKAAWIGPLILLAGFGGIAATRFFF